MKRGHVRGTKHERTGASDWYKTIEAEPPEADRSGMAGEAGNRQVNVDRSGVVTT